MSKINRPYSRVYWEAIDDTKFATVWDDDHALSAWLRLLVAADMAWPASATLYHGVRRTALKALVDAGLVDMQTGGRYRIHGLDKERQRRSDDARAAINTRWHGRSDGAPAYTDEDYGRSSDGIPTYPNGSTERIPSQDEPRRDEQSRAETEPSRAEHGARAGKADEPYRTAEELTGDFPVQRFEPNALRTLDALCDRRGIPAVVAAMRTVAPDIETQPPSPWQLVSAAVKHLEPFATSRKAPVAVGKGGVSVEEAERAFRS